MVAVARDSFNTKWCWEIGGESVLFGKTISDSPLANQETVMRITHGNVYSPIDHVKLFVRMENPDQPTEFADLHSANDWVEARVIEEIVNVNDVDMHRADATEPFGREEEVPWDGRFEAMLIFPPGKQSIEIKVLSKLDHPGSGVFSDWFVDVG